MIADFVIPFFYDSEDRMRNLFRSLIYITSQFLESKIYISNQIHNDSTNIIIDHIKEYNLKNIILVSIDIPLPCYKTKLNNIGINLSKKDIVVIYDCDVLIPKKQIEIAIDLLYDKGYSLIYPYSNPQYNVPQGYFKEFQKDYDFTKIERDVSPFQIPHEHKHKNQPVIAYSPGFCVMINKKKLGNHAYYNESFKSPQFEDAEYIFKMDFLNIEMTRVYGPVFHFIHQRTENTYKNIIEDNKKIYYSIIKWDQEKLTKYYKGNIT